VQVSFIIPLYNQLAFTRACLASLKSTLPPGLTYEIILVDDASTDGSRDFLRELPPPYVVLLNERNLGYAASNNRAARIAQGEFLVLLNNDLLLQAGWLEPMLAAFSINPRAGIVGNIQVAADTGEVDHVGIGFRDGGYPIHHREPVATAQRRGSYAAFPGGVTAACCALRREWFVRIGGFDEEYRNGFEDIDLCLRSREDGFINLTATASVVRHHISRSTGRAAYEYRNARRFLARWGPRCAALETGFDLSEARQYAATTARAYLSSTLHRFGFAPVAVRRQHKAALTRWRQAEFTVTRPIRVGVDLLRLSPGGANGGIKPLVYSFLAEIGRQRGRAFNFAIIAEKSLRDELTPLLRVGDYFLEPSCEHLLVSQRDAKGGYRDTGRFALSDDIGARARMDVLYCPFGVSQFMRPALPCVSLVVDLLHRDLPAALTPEEVNYRDQWFTRVAREATFIQGISRDAIARLGEYYGVHPSRCFHTYIPAQNRLPAPAPEGQLPAGAPVGPYFFYPANFWPHKNHETLFVAYRLHLQGAGSRAWPLILTGAPDERMTVLQEMCRGLGIADQVFFLGHLDDTAFSTVWSRAGALVFPSLNEGFGIPLLEAMRFGIPIIAAEATALPEIGGDACVYVDPADPRAIADVLRRVAIREALREDLVSRGRKRLGAFSLELEAGRLAHFLESAARRQTP
jgi:GT2 family glycosyltransferase/glycosyltransferase involved in cell wall biosynthesis